MTTYFDGDANLNNDILYAGIGATGSAIADNETTSLASIRIGQTFNGGNGLPPIPVADGSRRLTNGSDATLEYQGAGVPPNGFSVGADVGTSFSSTGVARGYLDGGCFNLNIGRNAGGQGEINVTGDDAGDTPGSLNHSASLAVGNDGSSHLEVTNGGSILIDGMDDVFPASIVANGRCRAQASGYALVT